MNAQEREELNQLERRHALLTISVSGLARDIARLKARVEVEPEPPQTATPPMQTFQPAPSPSATIATPPPLPPHVDAPVFVAPPVAANVHQQQTESPAPAKRETFEMKLGTYWLVRIGIVMLLTGLVFLGTYAYKNFIGMLGPAGKVALLYVASATLLGLGAWFQRKRGKDSLHNYGQVLFAGGLAAVYFTTYAAHYVPVLRVIASPIVDGLLLLAWGAVTIFLADRRKSEVLALFAIGLSYYTSAITTVGLFTLYSNLVLTVAAVFLLVRNRWATLSFISLVATYLGFVFWRFHQGGWSWGAREELTSGNIFLGGYWIFFTAAVFFARDALLVRARRAMFATLNNAAFFALVLLSIMQVSHDHFWKFSLGFGAVLLGCAAAARKFLSTEPLLKNAYLVQGLVLITMGVIAYFSGLQLALVLAGESVILTILGQQRNSTILRGGAIAAAALSGLWVIQFVSPANRDLFLALAISAAMLFNGWWEHRHDADPAPTVIRPRSGFFFGLAVTLIALITWHATPAEWTPVAWMMEALLLTAAFYLLRAPELPIFAQGLAVVAQCFWFFAFAIQPQRPHWLIPAALIGGLLALSHWWQRQRTLNVAANTRQVLQLVYALSLVGVLFFWLHPQFAPSAWLVFLNALAITLTLYGVLTRAWMLAASAQLFLLVSSFEFLRQLSEQKPQWSVALVPIATLLLISLCTMIWLSRYSTGDAIKRPLLGVSVVYRVAAFLMTVWWMFAYVPKVHQFWSFMLVGYGVFGVAGVWKSREATYYSAVFAVIALGCWWMGWAQDREVVTWPNALAIVSMFVVQQLLQRHAARWALPVHAGAAMMLISSCTLWAFVSRWTVLVSGAQFLLTVTWAALAFTLFALGFMVRERMYRWMGLAILALAIARVFLFDVWKLETIYRIFSFMALGLVLLTLGFIYNKYQEKIRHWL